MPYTAKQLTALQTALATGERRVTFADKTVEYRSVDELKEAIREVQNGLATQSVAQGTRPPKTRQIRVTTRKGF
jgi:hypothetical protein